MIQTRKCATILLFLLALASSACAAPGSGISRLGFAIQMGAFSSVTNAERFTTTLQKKGIEAFYFRKDNGIYAVRFGDFATKAKARQTADRLVADRLISSYYIAPPNEIVFTKPQAPGVRKPGPDEIRLPQYKNGESRRDGGYNGTEKPARPIDGLPAQKPQQPPSGDGQDLGSIAARTAERFVGIPYRWGGENVVDGMDCSGFVRAVFNLCGVSIPRTSREQFKAGESVAKPELRDGDLVFFGSSGENINHVGIFVGNGKFVHAPRRGEEIKVTTIDDNYFEKRFVGARRYFQ